MFLLYAVQILLGLAVVVFIASMLLLLYVADRKFEEWRRKKDE